MDDGRRGGWWPEEEGDGGRDPDADPGAAAGDRGPEAEADPGDEHPPPDPPPSPPPHGLASRDRPKVASRYSLFVGLAFVAIAIIAVLNATGSEEGGILGAQDTSGIPVPEFAVPDALSGNEADANIFQDDCESSRNPCPEGEVRIPACEIDAADAIRVCDLFDRPLAISFWFTRGGDCLPTQDAFDAVAARRTEDVNFLSINSLDELASVGQIIRERGWKVPVGHDADGAVSNLFGVGLCPTVVLVYPGGILADAEIEPAQRIGDTLNFTEAEIDSMVDDLIAESERREPAAG